MYSDVLSLFVHAGNTGPIVEEVDGDGNSYVVATGEEAPSRWDTSQPPSQEHALPPARYSGDELLSRIQALVTQANDPDAPPGMSEEITARIAEISANLTEDEQEVFEAYLSSIIVDAEIARQQQGADHRVIKFEMDPEKPIRFWIADMTHFIVIVAGIMDLFDKHGTRPVPNPFE